MKLSLVILAAIAVLLAAAFASSRIWSSSSASGSPSAAANPCGPNDVALFGHIKTLSRTGDQFELRFDPAWFLSGKTASRAALEDTGSSDVPNDNYIVEEGHRLLTYVVPTTAHITVLTKGGALDKSGFPSTEITVSQLAQLVKGEQPVKLYEGLDTGFWMHVNSDTVCSLQHQYHP
jgi:hypothetical protein